MTATQASALTGKEGAFEALASGEGSGTVDVENGRVVVDTSAPFESVKEAVYRFGGSAAWKSQLKQLFNPEKCHPSEDFELMNVQVQATQLQTILAIKERETLEVLKELENTKKTVDNLKIQLHDEGLSEAIKFPEKSKLHQETEREITYANSIHGGMNAAGSPGSILVELNQAKMILGKTTSYLTDIQASIQSINNQLHEEKALLVNNMEKISSKRAVVSSLDEELKQMIFKLQLAQDAKGYCNVDHVSISTGIRNLNFERGRFQKTSEAARSEVLRLASEIEQMNVSIKAAEIRWLAAKRMEEDAKATEAAALAQSKALESSNSSPEVIFATEEYVLLIRKVRGAEETSRKKIECAMLELERANQSKLDMVAKLEKAEGDVITSKKFLKEAVNRADVANQAKLATEEALRRWRSEHGQRKKYLHHSKFKNSCPSHQRRDLRIRDLNGLNLVNDDLRNGLKHTLSIGEILNRKLFGPGDDGYITGVIERSKEKPKVSLGQILNRRAEVLSPQNSCGSAHLHRSTNRKRFGFVLFSHLFKNERKIERSKRKRAKKNKNNRKRKQVSGAG